MPLAPQDVIEKLTTAIEESKALLRDLHAARSDTLAFLKRERDHIDDLLADQVRAGVEGMLADVRQRAFDAVDQLIEEIRTDWREKLGLAP